MASHVTGLFGSGILIRHLNVEGIIKGLGQNIYGVDLRMPTWNNARRMMETLDIPPPSLKALLLLRFRDMRSWNADGAARIRAVEVVKG